jgi:Gpi18-like mannosyltransferase
VGIIETARRRPLLASIASFLRTADRAGISDAVRLVVATHFVFFALAFASTWFLSTDTTGPSTLGFLDMWRRWDANHLVNIAEHGYFSSATFPNATAFFPLVPLAIRVLSWTGMPPVAAGLLLSAIGTTVALTYLYRLAESELGEGSGRRAMIYLALFPTAVFLVAPYSEPIYLAGAIAAFYYARRDRWLMVGPFAALAVGSRLAGLFLLFGLAVEFLRQRDFTKDRILNALNGLLMGGLPLVAYAVYLNANTGNPLQFLTSQREGWGREYVGPVASFLNTWRTWEGAYFTNWMFAWRVEILAALIGLAIVTWALLKAEWGYAAYMGAGLAALITSAWYYSIPRMLLTWFPIMLFLTEFSKRREPRHEIVLLTMAPFAGLGVILFTRNIWFF